MSSEWYGYNSSKADDAISKELAKLKEATDPVFETIIAGLTLAQQALRFLITLLNVIELPLITLLDEIIQTLEALKRDLQNAGVYLTWDREILKVLEDPYLLRGGYSAFEQRVIKKLSNTSDPTRPDFSKYSKTTALIAHAGGPVSAIFSIYEAVMAFIKLFEGDKGTTDTLPKPSNVEVGYFKRFSGFNVELDVQDIDKDNVPEGIRVKWEVQGRKNPNDFFPSFVIPPPYFWVIVSSRSTPLDMIKRFRSKDFVSDEDRGEVLASRVSFNQSKITCNSDMIGLIGNISDFPKPEGGLRQKGQQKYEFQSGDDPALTLEQALEEVAVFKVESSTVGAFFGSKEYELYIKKDELPKKLYGKIEGSYSNVSKTPTDFYVSVVSCATDSPPLLLQNYKEIYGDVKIQSQLSAFSERVRSPKVSLDRDDLTFLEVMRDCLALFCLGRFDDDLTKSDKEIKQIELEQANYAEWKDEAGESFDPFDLSDIDGYFEKEGEPPFIIDRSLIIQVRLRYQKILAENKGKTWLQIRQIASRDFVFSDILETNKQPVPQWLRNEDGEPLRLVIYQHILMEIVLASEAEAGLSLSDTISANLDEDYSVGNPLPSITRDNILQQMSPLTGKPDLSNMRQDYKSYELNKKIAGWCMTAVKNIYVYGKPDQPTLNRIKSDIQKLAEFSLTITGGIGIWNVLDKYNEASLISSTGTYRGIGYNEIRVISDGTSYDFSKVESYSYGSPGISFVLREDGTQIVADTPVLRPLYMVSSAQMDLFQQISSTGEASLKRSEKIISNSEFSQMLDKTIEAEGLDVNDPSIYFNRRSTYRNELESQGYTIDSLSEFEFPEEINSIPSVTEDRLMHPAYVSDLKDFRSLMKEHDVLDAYTNVMTTIFKGRPEIKGEWQFIRFFENGIPEVDVFLDEMIKFVRSVKSSLKSIVDTAKKYINTLNKRILEIQRVVYMLKRIIDSILAFRINASLDLLYIKSANGTQGLIEEIKQSTNKPPVTDTSAGAVLVAGGLPSLVLDLFEVIANPKKSYDSVNEGIEDFAEGLDKTLDPLT